MYRIFVHGRIRVRDQVPFVQHDDQRSPLARHQAGNGQVLALEWGGGVDHQRHHLGELERLQRGRGRQLLELARDLGLAAQTGGVDELDGSAAIVEAQGDAVAGQAGLGARQQAILVDQPIDQGRLAGIGTADHREPERPLGCLGLVRRLDHLEVGQDRLEQIGDAVAMLRGDRQGLAQSERPGFGELRRGDPALAFVGHQEHGLALAPQLVGEILVRGRHAQAPVDHEHADRGLGQTLHRLLAQAAREALRRADVEAGRVDDAELAPRQAAHALDAVARHARRVVDDRLPTADQPVEQGRLADIGAAEDRDRRQRHRNATSSALSVRKKTVPSATAAGDETPPPPISSGAEGLAGEGRQR